VDLDDRISGFRERLIRMETLRTQHLKQVAEVEKEIEDLTRAIEVHTKSSVVLKSLLHDMVEENLKSIDKLVTEGLRRVFHDQVNITFKSELVERNNQLQISFRTEQGRAEGSAINSFGASVTVVESLLLRIIVILKTGLAPVLLLDESLAQVSDEYIEPLGSLIQSLCHDLNMTVLLVTHQHEFQETADVVYKAECVEEGDIRTLVMKKIKDTYGDAGSH
jgi:DNA repair exonuclease SbcCD ATPase subunit